MFVSASQMTRSWSRGEDLFAETGPRNEERGRWRRVADALRGRYVACHLCRECNVVVVELGRSLSADEAKLQAARRLEGDGST